MRGRKNLKIGFVGANSMTEFGLTVVNATIFSRSFPSIRSAMKKRTPGQGLDLLETRVWDDVASGVIEV